MKVSHWALLWMMLIFVAGCAIKVPLEPLKISRYTDSVRLVQSLLHHPKCTWFRSYTLSVTADVPANEPLLEAWVASYVGGRLHTEVHGPDSFFSFSSELHKMAEPPRLKMSEAFLRMRAAAQKVYDEACRRGDISQDESFPEWYVPCRGVCLADVEDRSYLKQMEYALTAKLKVWHRRYYSLEVMVSESMPGACHYRTQRGVFDRQLGRPLRLEDVIKARSIPQVIQLLETTLGVCVSQTEDGKMDYRTLQNFDFTSKGIRWTPIAFGMTNSHDAVIHWEKIRPYLKKTALADMFIRSSVTTKTTR